MSASEPLFRLLYASRMTAAAAARPNETWRAILSIAVPNNRRLGVTGLLVAHRGWFLQALEGPEATVRDLYDQISADARHRDSVVIAEGRQVERAFGAWTMCAQSLSRTDEAVLATLDRKPSFDPTTFPERAVIRFLTAVGDVHAQAFAAQQALAAAPEPANP
jgi:hypothetical protein